MPRSHCESQYVPRSDFLFTLLSLTARQWTPPEDRCYSVISLSRYLYCDHTLQISVSDKEADTQKCVNSVRLRKTVRLLLSDDRQKLCVSLALNPCFGAKWLLWILIRCLKHCPGCWRLMTSADVATTTKEQQDKAACCSQKNQGCVIHAQHQTSTSPNLQHPQLQQQVCVCAAHQVLSLSVIGWMLESIQCF